MTEGMAVSIGFVVLVALVPVIGLIAAAVRVVQQYETAVVFRLGKLSRVLSPGLNFIIPVFEWTRVIDMRVVTHDIPKQQVITKDNIPASINGVLYFKVVDATTAIIKVQSYVYAVSQYAQAALRDVVGGLTLDELLAERQKIGDEIEAVIAKEAKNWGLEVTAIKIQDVDMPEELKKMMSRQASAEREKRATITKAEGDKLAAFNLAEAAQTMFQSPGAMQLRTLQTIDGLGPSASNTVVLAVPVEIMQAVMAIAGKAPEKKA
ncbi:MAG: SPFH domain-containing protein [Candidatus Omnitrophota bacterium]